MSDMPERCRAFWAAFCATQPQDPTPRFLEAFHFADRQDIADELGALVVAGTKRATAALQWAHEAENAPLPQPGALSIVTDFAGTPLCVIETTGVDVVAFEDVTAEFAATEGEGDGSLDFWRAAHQAYFGRECERLGRTPNPRMPVVCERFRVVFGGAAPATTMPSATPARAPMSERPALPDRLSTDATSPHYAAAVLEHPIVVRFNGRDRTDIEEYCISEGWVKVQAGKTVDRRGRPLLVKLKGSVEVFYR